MAISLAPILLAIELGFMFVLTWRTSRLAPAEAIIKPVYVYLLWVTAYGILASILGARGVYISEDILNSLPGFWLQLIPVAVCVFPECKVGMSRDFPELHPPASWQFHPDLFGPFV